MKVSHKRQRTQSFDSQANDSYCCDHNEPYLLKAGERRAGVNHTRGLELIRPQELRHCCSLYLYVNSMWSGRSGNETAFVIYYFFKRKYVV